MGETRERDGEDRAREEIMEAAYGIADAHGIAAVTVRGVAQACGVSVGTVYRHFPSKSDLTVAVIERFFARSFYRDFCRPEPGERFVDYAVRMRDAMRRVLDDYRARWLRGVSALPEVERVAAKAREGEQLEHVVRGLAHVFAADPAIDRASLPADVTARAVAELVLATVVGELRGGPRADTLFWALRRALYR